MLNSYAAPARASMKFVMFFFMIVWIYFRWQKKLYSYGFQTVSRNSTLTRLHYSYSYLRDQRRLGWHTGMCCVWKEILSLSFWIQRRVLGVSLLVCHVNTWCRPPCSKGLSVNDYRVAIRRRCDAWNCGRPGKLEYAKKKKTVRIVRPHWTSVSVARKLPRRCK